MRAAQSGARFCGCAGRVGQVLLHREEFEVRGGHVAEGDRLAVEAVLLQDPKTKRFGKRNDSGNETTLAGAPRFYGESLRFLRRFVFGRVSGSLPASC